MIAKAPQGSDSTIASFRGGSRRVSDLLRKCDDLFLAAATRAGLPLDIWFGSFDLGLHQRQMAMSLVKPEK